MENAYAYNHEEIVIAVLVNASMALVKKINAYAKKAEVVNYVRLKAVLLVIMVFAKKGFVFVKTALVEMIVVNAILF